MRAAKAEIETEVQCVASFFAFTFVLPPFGRLPRECDDCVFLLQCSVSDLYKLLFLFALLRLASHDRFLN